MAARRKSNLPAIPEAPRPHIQCCFMHCVESAIVYMHTKTGWVNVCRTHYPKIEHMPVITHNPFMDEMRAAYKSSPTYAKNHLPLMSKERYERIASENPPREPGSDDE